MRERREIEQAAVSKKYAKIVAVLNKMWYNKFVGSLTRTVITV